MIRKKGFRRWLVLVLATLMMFGSVQQAGATTINITINIKKSSNKINKKSKKKIHLSEKKLTLYNGLTYKLKLKGATKKVSWKTNKKSVVAIEKKKGNTVILSTQKFGTAVITAKYKGKKYKCKVKVVRAKEDIISEGNSFPDEVEFAQYYDLDVIAILPCKIYCKLADPNMYKFKILKLMEDGGKDNENPAYDDNYITRIRISLKKPREEKLLYTDYYLNYETGISRNRNYDQNGNYYIQARYAYGYPEIKSTIIIRNSMNPKEVDRIPFCFSREETVDKRGAKVYQFNEDGSANSEFDRLLDRTINRNQYYINNSY